MILQLTAAAVILSCRVLVAGPSASFSGETLIIRDGGKTMRLDHVVDSHSFFETIHSILRRDSTY